MAINYPLSLPTTPTPSRMLMRSINAVAMSQSPFTFEQQVFEHQGGIWGAEIALPPMERATAEAWLSFLLKLRGRNGTFLLPPFSAKTPRGIATGSPQVNLDVQTGLTLDTLGWTASQTGILKAGDYIQVMNNYLSFPEAFDNAVWVKANGTITATTRTAPDGTSTADEFTPTVSASDGRVTQTATIPSGITVGNQTFRFSMWSRLVSGSDTGRLRIMNQASVERAATLMNPTGTWGYFTLQVTMDPADTGIQVGMNSWADPTVIEIWGASLTSPQEAHLHKVLNDADSDANGLATFDIWPRLRADPKDHADIVVQTPAGLFRLARNDSEWDINSAAIYGLGISAMEAI